MRVTLLLLILASGCGQVPSASTASYTNPVVSITTPEAHTCSVVISNGVLNGSASVVMTPDVSGASTVQSGTIAAYPSTTTATFSAGVTKFTILVSMHGDDTVQGTPVKVYYDNTLIYSQVYGSLPNPTINDQFGASNQIICEAPVK